MSTKTPALEEYRHRPVKADEGFAMMSVIMLMMVVALLASIVLAVVVSQVSPTLIAEKNTRTLSAAQAGLDAASSQIRNATETSTGTPMGDMHKLPCVVKGSIDGTGGETSYKVQVQYFLTDPVAEDTAWRTGNALTCYTGTGTNGGVRSVPRFAMMTSEGFDAASTSQVGRADRVVESAYTFQLSTKKLGGGMILDEGSQFCLVADSPDEWSKIRYQPAASVDCQDQTDLNSWSWKDDYMLHLTANDRDGKIPLCITGRGNAGTVDATLRPCTSSSADPLGQRWAWSEAKTWQGMNAANTHKIASHIVNEDGHVDAGDRLSVGSGPGNASLDPLPAVGKGNASYLTNQVVNFNQYGRCLDVTDTDITKIYMIAFPCKQDPSGNGTFDWNHKWYYDEPPLGTESVPTQIKVNNGTEYCLITTTSTRTVEQTAPLPSVTASFPRFVKNDGTRDCSSGNTTWTRYGYSTDETLSYTFVDRHDKCLSGGGPNPKGKLARWTTITVATCDGGNDQKWNVPDTPVSASLGDFAEITNADAG